MAACSGNVLWTLIGNTYVGTISSTSIIVECIGGGVLGFVLTASYGTTSKTYPIDPSSTCDPFDLLFTDVATDCGIIDIEIKGDLSKCVPSSSSSSMSATPSSSSISSGNGSISGCFCPDLPSTLTLTVISGCDGANSPVTITYSPGGLRGAGWYSPIQSFNGHTNQWFMGCTQPVSPALTVFQIVDGSLSGGGSGSSLSINCSPFDSGNVSFASVSPCGLSAVVRITL